MEFNTDGDSIERDSLSNIFPLEELCREKVETSYHNRRNTLEQDVLCIDVSAVQSQEDNLDEKLKCS